MAVEGERLSPIALLISSILVLAVGANCRADLPGDLLQIPPVVGGLWLGALLLQASAIEWPGLYLFSSAPALSLAAAMLSHRSACLAFLISLSALFLRSLIRRRRNFGYTLQANLADAVPELLAICAISQGAPWLGCLGYAPLALAWSQFMLGQRTGLQMLGQYASVGCLALVAGNLDLAGSPWRLVPLLVVLAVLQRRQPGPSGQRPASRRLPLPGARPPAKTAAQLALESFPLVLSACRSQLAVLDALLKVVASLCPSRSTVIFLLQEGRLLPVRYHSPLQERLAAYSLLNLAEPAVESAWCAQAVLTFPPLSEAPRFFEGEPCGAALWMEQEGVLYVGRATPISEDELRSLEWVVTRAVAALRVVRSQENERLALEQYRREHERLEEELQRLQKLLDGTRQMASTLDLAALGERLEVMLRASLPHDFGAILTLGQGQLQLRREWGANLNPAAALAVCQAVLSHEIPFIFQRDSRMEPVVPSQTGLLAAPMQLEQGTTGVLLIGSRKGIVFEREHQDLLWLIGCLAAISFSNASLHHEVVSTQEQLMHAGKLAAIGQLAAGVAHELNTPLGAIQLCLDGLARQLKDSLPTAQKKLERGQLATNQAREIVDKLLVYSRREDKASHQPVEVAQVVRDSLELVGPQLKRDGLRLELDLAELPPVLGVELELRQVLTNLLMNARDAALSPNASARDVKIQTRCQDGSVWIRVFDRGPGVAPEIEKRIFEPFFTTKPVGRGTGLGLSISYRIAVKHGGSLEYQSPPEGGACFSLRLPAGAQTL